MRPARSTHCPYLLSDANSWSHIDRVYKSWNISVGTGLRHRTCLLIGEDLLGSTFALHIAQDPDKGALESGDYVTNGVYVRDPYSDNWVY